MIQKIHKYSIYMCNTGSLVILNQPIISHALFADALPPLGGGGSGRRPWPFGHGSTIGFGAGFETGWPNPWGAPSGRIVLLPFQRTKNGLKKTHGHIKPTKLPRYGGFLKCRSSSKFYHDFVLNPPEMTGIHWDFTIQIHGRKLCHEWK